MPSQTMDSTPILRVSRPVSACTRCKRTKIKCDGKLPACSACEKSGAAAECTGSVGEFARGKERSYVASLEGRIAMLERKLAALDGEAMISGTQTPQTLPVNTQSAKKKAESAHVEDLVSDLGFITVNATSKGLYDFSHDMSFAKLVLVASARNTNLPALPSPLPPRHITAQLVQYYLTNVFIQYPFFDEALLHISVNSVYGSERFATGPNLYMVYMILAVSTLAQSRTKDALVRATAAGYVVSALQYSKMVIVPYSSIGIQALLLLLQYSLRDPRYFDPWYLIGVASRITIDLGLHQDVQKQKSKSSEVELRRRLFYSVYAYDRYIAMTTERPYAFSDESINVRLPIVTGGEMKSGQPIPLTTAVEKFKLAKLSSVWYQHLYFSESRPIDNPAEYLNSCHAAMKSWLQNLPTSIDLVRREWLKLEYFYTTMVLFSSAGDCPRITQPTEAMYRETIDACISYTTTLQKLLTLPANTSSQFPYTFKDAIRLHHVGEKLIAAVCRSEEWLHNDKGRSAMGVMTVDSLRYLFTFFVSWFPEAAGWRDAFERGSGVVKGKLEEWA